MAEKKDKSVKVAITDAEQNQKQENVFDESAPLGSEKNPMRVMHVYPEPPEIAKNLTVGVDDCSVEDKARDSLYQVRYLAETIALAVIGHKDNKYVLTNTLMETGKHGDYPNQAELLAAKSFKYAQELKTGLDGEFERAVAKLVVEMQQSELSPAEDGTNSEGVVEDGTNSEGVVEDAEDLKSDPV